MSLVGEPISDQVIKQLQQRENIHSKSQKTRDDLLWINSKNAWIRAISGVNVLGEEEVFGEDKGSPNQSKSFILTGGSISWNSETKSFQKNNNISFDKFETTSKYRYTEDFGVRPEPGITSFQITSKNTFGSIRSADIGFTVWSKEDLEKVRTLYLRLGFPIIVEWGHSVYVDKDNTTKTSRAVYDSNFDNYFTTNDFMKIVQQLEENRIRYNYCYDGFIGYVNNFSFSFNTQGGYDCTISVVSHGSILTALSPTPGNDIVNDEIDVEDEQSEVDDFEYTLNLFLEVIKEINDNQSFTENVLGYDNLIVERKEKVLEEVKKRLRDSLGEELKDFHIIRFLRSEENLSYISLRVFLSLMNTSFETKDKETGNRLPGTKFYLRRSNEYVTFQNHFSIFPNKFIKPKEVVQVVKLEKRAYPDWEKYINLLEEVKKSGQTITIRYLTKVMSGLNRFSPDGSSILDIRVSIPYLLEKYNQYTKTTLKSKESIYGFVESVLNDLEESFGHINDFDLHYNESIEQYEIVDRNLNPYSNYTKTVKNNIKPVPILESVGLKSTFSDLKITSKISNELASQIAISANTSQNFNEDRKVPYLIWNEGLSPRFQQIEKPNTKSPTNQEETSGSKTLQELGEETSSQPLTEQNSTALQRLRQGIKDIAKYLKTPASELNKKETSTPTEKDVEEKKRYKFFLNTSYIYEIPKSIEHTRTFNTQLAEKILPDFFKRTKEASSFYNTYSSISTSTSHPDGLIPVEISFTTEGISGMKIGQVFRLGSPSHPSLVLPKQYNNYGFIITGLDHSISDGKWTTNVKGLTFNLNLEVTPEVKESIQQLESKPGEF